MDPAKAWPLFQRTLTADLDDTQGGTTEHGIHLGAMAGTIDIVTRSFAAVTVDGNAVRLDPRLPARLAGAGFELQHRGQRFRVSLTPAAAEVRADPCAANPETSTSESYPASDDGGRSPMMARHFALSPYRLSQARQPIDTCSKG